jgi:hypothetical protein
VIVARRLHIKISDQESSNLFERDTPGRGMKFSERDSQARMVSTDVNVRIGAIGCGERMPVPAEELAAVDNLKLVHVCECAHLVLTSEAPVLDHLETLRGIEEEIGATATPQPLWTASNEER